jgi:hypothetical protein
MSALCGTLMGPVLEYSLESFVKRRTLADRHRTYHYGKAGLRGWFTVGDVKALEGSAGR